MRYLIIFLVFISACSSNDQQIKQELKTCLQANSALEENFLRSLETFESNLIENNNLAGPTKQSYQNLLVSIIEQREVFNQKEISEGIEEFWKLQTPSSFASYPHCSQKIAADFQSRVDSTYSIFHMSNLYKKMDQQSGFKNKELLTQLINGIKDSDFEQIEYRGAILTAMANYSQQ